MEAEAEIAALRAEVESLKTLVQQQSDGGGEAFGPDMGLPIVPLGGGGTGGAFRIEDGKMVDCWFMAGYSVCHLEDYQLGAAASGTVSLEINVTNPGSSRIVFSGAEEEEEEAEESFEKVSVPLYELEDGEVKHDMRGMPYVQRYA